LVCRQGSPDEKRQRNISLKRRPVQPHGITKVSFTEHITITDSVVFTVIHADGTQEKFGSPPEPAPPPKPTEVTMEQTWYFNELPDGNNDVMSVCEQHITKLEALVNECESLFTL
jgi:hypothetical protein